MEPNFVAKNAGAKVCVYDKYITLKSSLVSRDVTIPMKEISSIENGLIYLEVHTKDKRSYKVALRGSDKEKVVNKIREKIIE